MSFSAAVGVILRDRDSTPLISSDSTWQCWFCLKHTFYFCTVGLCKNNVTLLLNCECLMQSDKMYKKYKIRRMPQNIVHLIVEVQLWSQLIRHVINNNTE